MNVPGPSRPRGSTRESTYERDLRAIFADLTVDEMDEIQTVFARNTGARVSDYDVAMNDLMHQARALAIAQQDRALAQRIAEGEDLLDADPLPHPRVNVGGAIQGQGRDRPRQGVPVARNNTDPSQTWGGWFSSMMSWMLGGDAPGSTPAPPAPAPAPAPVPAPAPTSQPVAPQSTRLTGHDCIICQDPIRGVEVRTPCGHYYDIGCITDLFQSATKDETLFPPRCCRQDIPIPLVRPHLVQTLLVTLDEKRVEFGTLKRVYCSSPTCSRFLGPLSETPTLLNKVYTCYALGCGRRTCGKCRAQYTDWMHVCNPDADEDAVLALGQRAGWARCPGCAQLIELHLGCFHMTCRCRTEFCYLCRARWKSCTCPQWDERRLMAVAEERVNAQLGRQQARRPAPVFAPAPAPVPARAPPPVPVPARRPAENVIAVPVARPVPPPVPAQRPRPVLAPTPAAPPVPVRLPGMVDAEAIAARRASLLGTSSTGASASASTPSWRQHASTSNTSASTGGNTSTASTSTSALASTSASIPSWRSRVPTSSASASASASTSNTNAGSSPTTSPSTLSWRQHAKANTDANTDVMRQRLVREMMDRLRVDHECSHEGWRYRKGGGICQSCGNHLPLYLFRCQGCEMLACNRCRRNRL